LYQYFLFRSRCDWFYGFDLKLNLWETGNETKHLGSKPSSLFPSGTEVSTAWESDQLSDIGPRRRIIVGLADPQHNAENLGRIVLGARNLARNVVDDTRRVHMDERINIDLFFLIQARSGAWFFSRDP
jgi:hypothetical protein